MIVIMSVAVLPLWREVVLLSGDCVDIYSTSDLFVCILGFFLISILRKRYSNYIVKKKNRITPALLYEMFCILSEE